MRIGKPVMILVLLLSNQSETWAQGIFLQFNHELNNTTLNIDSGWYSQSNGDSFTISTFKYYVSNIRLFAADGKKINMPGYFLVNESDPSTKRISLKKVPAGIYDSLQFIVGVDSARNCAGAQDGDLDPLNGMFWTWKSGYIFLKLEGHSPSSTLRGQKIEYHIGGYRPPANCIRKVTLYLQPVKTTAIQIAVAIDRLFPDGFRIAKIPSITGIDHAVAMANLFPELFSVTGQTSALEQ